MARAIIIITLPRSKAPIPTRLKWRVEFVSGFPATTKIQVPKGDLQAQMRLALNISRRHWSCRQLGRKNCESECVSRSPNDFEEMIDLQEFFGPDQSAGSAYTIEAGLPVLISPRIDCMRGLRLLPGNQDQSGKQMLDSSERGTLRYIDRAARDRKASKAAVGVWPR